MFDTLFCRDFPHSPMCMLTLCIPRSCTSSSGKPTLCTPMLSILMPCRVNFFFLAARSTCQFSLQYGTGTAYHTQTGFQQLRLGYSNIFIKRISILGKMCTGTSATLLIQFRNANCCFITPIFFRRFLVTCLFVSKLLFDHFYICG